MKVVLTTLNAKYIHSALALRYLRTYVTPQFPDTEVREYTIKDVPSHIVADLYAAKPDVIGFSIYIWNVEQTIPLIAMLKKVLPSTRIVLGGPEVSYDTEYWMERVPTADCIVQGEGESAFLAILESFAASRSLANVNGIAYRDNGTVRMSPQAGKLDLTTLESPYANDTDLGSLRDRVVYYETSRGCPFSCQFCLSSIESGVRYFPIERVKSDLLRLMDAGVRTIKFVDRTFNLKRDYAVELFQFLIDNQRDTVFQFEITGDILHPQTVEFLTENVPAGLFRFEIGVQSTNDMTNTLVKRRQNFDRLQRNILALKENGRIVLHLDLIAGLPGEDYDSFRKTFDDVFVLQPDELQLGFLKMLRGTGLRHQAQSFGYVFMDHAPYEVFRNDVLSYDDVLRIKQVEDVLEKYWNEGKLRHTVRYLTQHVYKSPFDFFQQFGSYWEREGWSRIGHQLEDLFVRLERFLLDSPETRSIHEAAKSYMLYDFLLQHRIRPHKVWWERQLLRRDRTRMRAYIERHPEIFGPDFMRLHLSSEDLEKHAVLEVLPRQIHPTHPEQGPNEGPCLLLFYYPPGLRKGERPLAFITSVLRHDDSGELAELTGTAQL